MADLRSRLSSTIVATVGYTNSEQRRRDDLKQRPAVGGFRADRVEHEASNVHSRLSYERSDTRRPEAPRGGRGGDAGQRRQHEQQEAAAPIDPLAVPKRGYFYEHDDRARTGGGGGGRRGGGRFGDRGGRGGHYRDNDYDDRDRDRDYDDRDRDRGRGRYDDDRDRGRYDDDRDRGRYDDDRDRGRYDDDRDYGRRRNFDDRRGGRRDGRGGRGGRPLSEAMAASHWMHDKFDDTETEPMRDEEVREEEPPTELIDADDVVRDEIPAKEPEGLGTIVAGDIELDYS